MLFLIDDFDTICNITEIYWAKELTKRLGADSQVYVNAFHPGCVATEIWEKGISEEWEYYKAYHFIISYLAKNVMFTSNEASLTALYLGVSEEVITKDIRGKYFHPIAQEITNPFAQDEELQSKLWAFLDELVGDYLPEN